MAADQEHRRARGGLPDELIFPDASSQADAVGAKYAHPTRTSSEPLLPGDFVDLPTLKAGSVLDFFLISDGANGGKTVVTANAARNYDRLSHAVAFALPDSPYLILGFEDGWKGGTGTTTTWSSRLTWAKRPSNG